MSSNDSTDQQTITWREAWLTALFRPNLVNYRSLAQNNSITKNRAYLWIIISAFIASLSFPVRNPIYGQQVLPSLLQIAFVFILWPLIFLAMTIIILVITNAIAKLFGGNGEFIELTRIIAAFIAPTTIASVVFVLIPTSSMLITQILPQ